MDAIALFGDGFRGSAGDDDTGPTLTPEEQEEMDLDPDANGEVDNGVDTEGVHLFIHFCLSPYLIRQATLLAVRYLVHRITYHAS